MGDFLIKQSALGLFATKYNTRCDVSHGHLIFFSPIFSLHYFFKKIKYRFELNLSPIYFAFGKRFYYDLNGDCFRDSVSLIWKEMSGWPSQLP